MAPKVSLSLFTRRQPYRQPVTSAPQPGSQPAPRTLLLRISALPRASRARAQRLMAARRRVDRRRQPLRCVPAATTSSPRSGIVPAVTCRHSGEASWSIARWWTSHDRTARHFDSIALIGMQGDAVDGHDGRRRSPNPVSSVPVSRTYLDSGSLLSPSR
jgi:hypothetical protein